MSPAFLTSCSASQTQEPAGTMMEVRVDAGLSGTKADSWWLIRRLDIFTFDEDAAGVLDSYQCSLVHSSAPVAVLTGRGVRRAVVIANMDLDDAVPSRIGAYTDLAALETVLTADSPLYPVMCGEAVFEAGSGRTCTVTLTPVLCEIDVSLVFESGVSAGDSAAMDQVQVYLTGVSARTDVMRQQDFKPSEILCSGGLVERDLQSLAYPRMLCQYLGSVPLSGAARHCALYCYPNSTTQDRESAGSPVTRLVVEGLVGGSLRQWSVPLDDLERNTRYHLSLRITK